MPIYEFRCMKCNACFELLMMNRDETVETRCPECQSEEFERIMSASRYSVSGGGEASEAVSRTRNCPGGSCTTYDLPGPAG
jgi:putative FmdB family regulatory protein